MECVATVIDTFAIFLKVMQLLAINAFLTLHRATLASCWTLGVGELYED
jgi:hypothetical protein